VRENTHTHTHTHTHTRTHIHTYTHTRSLSLSLSFSLSLSHTHIRTYHTRVRPAACNALMHIQVSDGQRRRVQICVGLLRPFKVWVPVDGQGFSCVML
jgi:hypothetical protein